MMAVIEQATTPNQHVQTMAIGDYANMSKPQAYISPTLVIIGKVVELQKQFAWIDNNTERSFYFDTSRKPLESLNKVPVNWP
jgi:hypothetical protein